jgi:hypothetical protein
MVLRHREIVPTAGVHVGICSNPQVGPVYMRVTAIRVGGVIGQKGLKNLGAIEVSGLEVHDASNAAVARVC